MPIAITAANFFGIKAFLSKKREYETRQSFSTTGTNT